MSLSEDISYVRLALQAFAEKSDPVFMSGVAGGRGVPPEMFDGEVDEQGWVLWQMLPSKLTDAEVVDLESDLGVQLPPLFRAYLLANFHLFDQVHSSRFGSDRFGQLIFNTCVPSNEPLGPLRHLIGAWKPLLAAEFIPFAEWGDGWGPMCFDAANRDDDGDCPIVWMDHEHLHPLGPDGCGDRVAVTPYVQPLYTSYRDFFSDVFG